jgi:hypothetical protein
MSKTQRKGCIPDPGFTEKERIPDIFNLGGQVRENPYATCGGLLSSALSLSVVTNASLMLAGRRT